MFKFLTVDILNGQLLISISSIFIGWYLAYCDFNHIIINVFIS